MKHDNNNYNVTNRTQENTLYYQQYIFEKKKKIDYN